MTISNKLPKTEVTLQLKQIQYRTKREQSYLLNIWTPIHFWTYRNQNINKNWLEGLVGFSGLEFFLIGLGLLGVFFGVFFVVVFI